MRGGIDEGPSVLRVLVLEDSPLDQRMVGRLVDGTGVQLYFCKTVARGLERLAARRYDAVLLDLHLPDSSGLDTLRRVQAGSENLPIVLLTGYDDDELAREAVHLGAQDYLAKGSIDRRLLIRSLRYAVERKRAEVELRQSADRLRRAERIEAIGQLAGGVAHDFNNLLTVITGQSEALLADLETGDPRRQSAEHIERAAHRAARLVRQLLAFSQRLSIAPMVVELNSIVADTAELLRRAYGDEITVECQLGPEVGSIEIDRAQLEQCLLQLASNARDAMPVGSHLMLRTEVVERVDAEFENGAELTGPLARLTVTDDGRGMNEAMREHAFEPFFTTKHPSNRGGLGLATVYGIVRQSGGLVGVKSEPGRGTTIALFLPLVPSPAKPRDAQRPTVLVVEDEDAVRQLILDLLDDGGYEAVGVANPEAAISAAGTPGRMFDYLIVDVVLPGMPGPNLAAELHASQPQAALLFVSGFDDALEDRPGLVRHLLGKPFSRRDLLDKLREVAAIEGRPISGKHPRPETLVETR